jgi:dipeptidyl-peptidase 4
MLAGMKAHTYRLILFFLLSSNWLHAQTRPPRFTIDQVLSPAFPYGLVAARTTDRIAWIENERGMRNVYTAAAPAFTPVRVTSTTEDDGLDLRPLQISDDGSIVAYIRGHAPGVGGESDTPGWIANPAIAPDGGRNEVWAASTTGDRKPWPVVEARNFALSPDGRSVLYTKDGQIYRTVVDARAASNASPFFRDFGVNGSPVWSPDGRKVAYISTRKDHSFIGVVDVATRKITYMTPSVDLDSAPVWSADSKRIAFLRRPGLPFGVSFERPRNLARNALPAGFVDPKFSGGYTLGVWIADVETGEGSELWHNAPGDTVFARVNRIYWAGDHIVFDAEPDNWRHYYSVSISNPRPAPLLLTPGDGEVEQVSFSNDGRWLYYAANIGDLDRRQLWRVPVAGGNAEQLTKAPGLDTFPVVLASGAQVAVMHAESKRPLLVALVPARGGEPRTITKPPVSFPSDLHVEPQAVEITAADGLKSHAQMFLPPDLKPGEKRPALLFIHGGSRQQTLLGYHYQQPHGFYHMAYAICQYFANKGYIVLSENYRSGIGYGRAFREATEVEAAGNAEYRDILAAGLWLKQRSDVDPARVGVWGLSYGGILTAQALARNSDVFAAGADIGGQHLLGNAVDPAALSFQSSSISAIEKWRSPVILFHGDDDRNVRFNQTVGLVQLLRAHNIPFELHVYPNETHYFQVFSRWTNTLKKIDDFFERALIRKEGVGSSRR